MQKPAYDMPISDWSSAVCPSDLLETGGVHVLLGLVGDAFAVGGLVVQDGDVLAGILLGQELARHDALRIVTPAGAEDVVPAVGLGVLGQRGVGRADRKSTRLTSSP